MSKLVLIEYVSLDGVVQAPGHDAEDTDGGFTLGGWAGPNLADHREYGTALYENAGGFLFGRRTYEIWLPHWSAVTDPSDGIAAALNSRPKYVASRTLTEPTWRGTTVWSDEIPLHVVQAKAELDGDLVVAGSSQLVQTLIHHDLVDTYQLWLHPVVLGTGKRLFPDGTPPTHLKLTTTTTSPTGLAILTYERR